jgi:hypothetical protein
MAWQHDVDRALPILDVGVADVGEHAPLGRFLDEVRIAAVDECDHRAGGLLHDPLDQPERMIGALPEPDQRDVGSLPGGHRSDVFDVDLARDHLVPQCRDDRSDESEAVLALVGNQDAQVLGLAVGHQRAPCSAKSNPGRARRRTLSHAPARRV